MFQKLTLYNWRQFESVDIDFDRQVTVITGPNGSGKTTILNILGKHVGWDINFTSTPYVSKRSNKRIWSDVEKTRHAEMDDDRNENINIGQIQYSNEKYCTISTPVFVKPQYQLKFSSQLGVPGLLIPSHRSAISYQTISKIPTDPQSAQEHYQQYQQLVLQTYGTSNVRNPGARLKESLLSLALLGPGSHAVIPNKDYEDIYYKFENILREVLPESLGFQRLEIRMPEVVFITDTGEFSLDAMSGGINDIFAMAWQIHMYGYRKATCTVLIDEPENHLHPSMQRSFLPSIAKAFPNYKFIIATHSPFILSSMPEARVYGLIYKEHNKIFSDVIEGADLSGTPNKILREILDVPSNLPIWTEEKIKTIVDSAKELEGEEKANKIIDELDKLGFSDMISDIRLD